MSGGARRSALECKSLILDKEISWSGRMNRLFLEINCQQSAAAEDCSRQCAGDDGAGQVRRERARSSASDHKHLVILCFDPDFSRLNWIAREDRRVDLPRGFRVSNQSGIGSKPANISADSDNVLSGIQSQTSKNLFHIARTFGILVRRLDCFLRFPFRDFDNCAVACAHDSRCAVCHESLFAQ